MDQARIDKLFVRFKKAIEMEEIQNIRKFLIVS